MIAEILAMPEWEPFEKFVNSNVFTAIVGAFAGAWAGGRVAQVIATRAKAADDLRKEIGLVNAAAMMASTICDGCTGFLRQHIKPLKLAFDADLARVIESMASAPEPDAPPVQINANFQRLLGPTLALEPLQRLIFEMPESPRSLRLFLALSDSVVSLHDLNQKRNVLMEEFKRADDPLQTLMFRYFGLRDPRGRHDEEYKTALEGMFVTATDGIFFSMHLTLALSRYAGHLCEQHKKYVRKSDLKAVQVDFSRLTERGVMPDPEQYQDWLPLTVYPPVVSRWSRLKNLGWSFLGRDPNAATPGDVPA